MVCRGGAYVSNLVDSSISDFPLLVLGLAQLLAIHWVYGYENFADDVQLMLGRRPNFYWKVGTNIAQRY